MNGKEILHTGTQQLAAALAESGPLPFEPLAISPWIGMSLLQKAVRRGRVELALHAAATLLQISPERLWRRLSCIVFEDIGLADIPTLSLVTASLAGKRIRARLGGEWSVAACVVRAMSEANKCRAADDLLMVAEQHSSYEVARRDFATLGTRQLLDIVAGDSPLPERAIALWYAIGTDRRPSPRLQMRRGEPHAVFDFLCDLGYPDTLVEIARAGFGKTREVLCPFVVLLFAEFQQTARTLTDDEMPPEVTVRDIPGWAYDVYSREGRIAFQIFLDRPCKTSRWIRSHVSPRDRINALGGLVFRCEGGRLKSRVVWERGEELRRLYELECLPGCQDASEILALMTSDLPLLNRVRSNAL